VPDINQIQLDTGYWLAVDWMATWCSLMQSAARDRKQARVTRVLTRQRTHSVLQSAARSSLISEFSTLSLTHFTSLRRFYNTHRCVQFHLPYV